MALFRAIGLGIVILVLYILLPVVLSAIVDTVLLGLELIQDTFELARAMLAELSVTMDL